MNGRGEEIYSWETDSVIISFVSGIRIILAPTVARQNLSEVISG